MNYINPIVTILFLFSWYTWLQNNFYFVTYKIRPKIHIIFFRNGIWWDNILEMWNVTHEMYKLFQHGPEKVEDDETECSPLNIKNDNNVKIEDEDYGRFPIHCHRGCWWCWFTNGLRRFKFWLLWTWKLSQ